MKTIKLKHIDDKSDRVILTKIFRDNGYIAVEKQENGGCIVFVSVKDDEILEPIERG